MARKEKLTNITDVLGFVYDADTLPTAVIDFRESSSNSFVVSVHALREGNADLLKTLFQKNDMDYDEEFVAYGLRFWEDYSRGDHICHGMFYKDGAQDRMKIGNIEDWATKSHEMCA